METSEKDDDVMVIKEIGPVVQKDMDLHNDSNKMSTPFRPIIAGLRVIKDASLLVEKQPLDLSLGTKRPPEKSLDMREVKKGHLSSVPPDLMPILEGEKNTSQDVNVPGEFIKPRTSAQEIRHVFNSSALGYALESPLREDQLHFRPHGMHPNSQEYFNAIQSNLLHQKRLAEASTLSVAGFPITYVFSWMKSMEQRRLEDVKIIESLKNQVEALTEKIANSDYLQRDSSTNANSANSEHFSKPESVEVPQGSREDDSRKSSTKANSTSSEHFSKPESVHVPQESREDDSRNSLTNANSTSSEHFSKPESVQVPQESRADEIKIEVPTETSVHEREEPESISADVNPSDFCDDDGSLEDDNDTESTEPNDGDQAASSNFDNSRDTVNLLSDDIKEFTKYCKQEMKIRGLTYNDVMNWSKSRFYFTNVCKISQFFNRKLDEKKSRDMMTMLKEFLDYKPKLVDSTNVVLPEEVERFIDESKTIMMSRGLTGLDFVAWTKKHFPVGLKYFDVGLFLNKKLEEEKSRAMMPILKLFLEDESWNHRPRKVRVRERFSSEQVAVLTEAFTDNMYPDKFGFDELAKKVKTTRIRVKRWFMNKRKALNHGRLLWN